VRLLRGFELRLDGEAIPVPSIVERLVAFLALHDRFVNRPFVAGTLWPDASDDRAGASLRSALWRLRQLVRPVVVAVNDRLGLAGGTAVDLRDASEVAHRILAPSARAAPPRSGAAILTGDLLPGWSDDWVVLERERFRQLRLHALERLCDQLSAAGRFAEATEAGLAAVAGEPLRESAHRALIRAYLAEGNRGQALGQYERLRTVLRDELGVSPSPLVEGVMAELDAGDAADGLAARRG